MAGVGLQALLGSLQNALRLQKACAVQLDKGAHGTLYSGLLVIG